MQFPAGSLILPDTAIAFLLKNGARPISQKTDAIEAILIPISSSTIIVASNKHYMKRPLSVLNSVLASCSFESFIAMENRLDFGSLTNKIGRNARLLQDSEIAKVVRSLDFEKALS